jgi:hypothetical protein
MKPQIERYEKLADHYDRMANATDDRTLRIMYLRFGQLWRDAAQMQREDDVLPRTRFWQPENRLTVSRAEQ